MLDRMVMSIRVVRESDPSHPLGVSVLLHWWSRQPVPQGLSLKFRNVATNAIVGTWTDLSPSQWSTFGPRMSSSRVRLIRTIRASPGWMTGYQDPNAQYEVTVRDSASNVLATAEFETFPQRLPTEYGNTRRTRDFSILVGSCYYEPTDNNRVNRAVEGINSILAKPHLSVLLGDQVYLDNPPWYYSVMTTQEIQERIARKYARSWVGLDSVLTTAQTVLLTDDHEYWNDYPFRPHRPGPWAALHNSSFRRTWRRETQAAQAQLQPSPRFMSATIGNDLALGFLDIRRFRTKEVAMPAADFRAAKTWIETLQTPAVLFMSQPLFQPDKSYFYIGGIGNFTSDRNATYYGQIWGLFRLLKESEHDVLIVAGDPHYGRLSRWHGPNSSIYELISSPLSHLPSATSKAQWVGYRQWPSDSESPPQSVARPHWLEFLATSPLTSDSDRHENHFMTLRFRRQQIGVRCEVACWLTHRFNPNNQSIPVRAWRRVLYLDSGEDRHPPPEGFQLYPGGPQVSITGGGVL